MTPLRLVSPRPAAATGVLAALLVALAACSTADASPTPAPTTPSPEPTASPTPATLEPTPTPEPTPRFTNEPDPELAGLLPATVNGVPLVVAPLDDFGLTPGDFGTAYGEIGVHFASLALAYVGQPRTSLYATRVDGERVSTEDLEPHLATAGRYVGIAGLEREPWQLTDVGGTLAWVRPEDDATVAGTMIYTWSSGEFIFLLIGVDDATNRAIIEQLPGEPAPTPSPTPSPTPTPSAGEAEPSPTGDG